MAFFDDVSVLVGKGMNSVDKKAQTIKLQANLSTVNDSLKKAYIEFGQAVYANERSNSYFASSYSAQIDRISDLEGKAAEIHRQIDEINRAQSVPPSPAPVGSGQSGVPTGHCANCGCQVSISYQRCPQCGNNLADLKSRYVWCPSCGAYYPVEDEIRFCMNCGHPTEPVPVAEPLTAPGQTAVPAAEPESAPVPTPTPEPVSAPTFEPANAPEPSTAPGAASNASDSAGSTGLSNAVAPVPDQPQPQPLVCPGCGQPIDAEDVFCGTCGTKLK